jgi:hypothetical protein
MVCSSVAFTKKSIQQNIQQNDSPKEIGLKQDGCHFGELHGTSLVKFTIVVYRVRKAKRGLRREQAKLSSQAVMAFQQDILKVLQDLLDCQEFLARK